MIEILHPGLLTTVQDAGRFGHLAQGIPPNGAMDRFALRAVNALLGNALHETVLEMHTPAARLRVTEPCVLCLGGGQAHAALSHAGSSIDLPFWRPIYVPDNSELTFGGRADGFRIYLAVLGGFGIPEWLGSCSTNLMAAIGGFQGRALKASDRLVFRSDQTAHSTAQRAPWFLSPELIHATYRARSVRILPGPEWSWLDADSQLSLFDSQYTLATDSNRTGYRLNGPQLSRTLPTRNLELVSGPVTFGTIQLPPSGRPIILMADHPTTGGYPRIALVVASDLPYLAQRSPGDALQFTLIKQAEAELLYLTCERELPPLRDLCALRMQAWLSKLDSHL